MVRVVSARMPCPDSRGAAGDAGRDSGHKHGGGERRSAAGDVDAGGADGVEDLAVALLIVHPRGGHGAGVEARDPVRGEAHGAGEVGRCGLGCFVEGAGRDLERGGRGAVETARARLQAAGYAVRATWYAKDEDPADAVAARVDRDGWAEVLEQRETGHATE